MVKLLKHELLALFRILFFFAVAVVVFAVAGRILLTVQLHNGGDFSGVLAVLFVVFYICAILALIFAAWAIGVSRFYKTLFTGEGYMTLSLPVSPSGVIAAKLLSSLIAVAAAAAVSVLSLCIFLVGLDIGLLQNLGLGISEAFETLGSLIAAEPLVFAEEIILAIVSLPASLLVLYACIAAGQLFTNRRKLMTFLLIIGVYILYEMLSVFCFMPIMAAAEDLSAHLALWIEIILVAAADVGCFFFVRYILKNKINLVV